MSLAEEIKREALALGFDAVGISQVKVTDQPSAFSLQPDFSLPDPRSPLSHDLFSRLAEWLQLGYHGTMAWMTRDPSSSKRSAAWSCQDADRWYRWE